MSRIFSHQWSNKKPFTRRVQWYCDAWERGKEDRTKNIRLQFEDELGVFNKVYGDDKITAEQDWKDFRNGKTTLMFLHPHKCTHPDHTDERTCEDRAISCHQDCECWLNKHLALGSIEQFKERFKRS